MALRLVIALGIFAVSLFLAAFAAIYYLQHRLGHITAQRATDQQTIAHLTRQNTQLGAEINRKDTALDRLHEVERMVGMSKQEGLSSGELEERLQDTRNNLVLRNFILSQIPNGMPLHYDGAYISSGFGSRLHPISHQRIQHNGVDIAVPLGTPIYATASGIVSHSRLSTGYGEVVVVTHNYGFKTYYAHLGRRIVKTGEYIQKGQVLGYSGSTGHSTGPHCHYEVRYLSRAIDPTPFLEWNLKNYQVIAEHNQGHIDWTAIYKTLPRAVLLEHPY